MNVLALDLSLSATGVIGDGMGASLIRGKHDGVKRLAYFEDQVRDLVENWSIDLAVIEDLPRIANIAAVPLGMLHGVVRLYLYTHEIPMVFAGPTSLKKYATGKGNATKPDMRMELYKRAGIEWRDDNLVDAWWLWHLAKDHYGEPEFEMPASHRVALDKIEWPEIAP